MLAERGEADQIGEQDRDEAAFRHRCRGRRGLVDQRLPALATELVRSLVRAPQTEQRTSRGAPHSAQNLRPGRFSVPHPPQVIAGILRPARPAREPIKLAPRALTCPSGSSNRLRVLRYLPTSMQGPEIAAELFDSLNTIRTHMRHLYGKLGVHRRTDAVERALELGLLAPRS